MLSSTLQCKLEQLSGKDFFQKLVQTTTYLESLNKF